jgi:uncharacterized protein YhaN
MSFLVANGLRVDLDGFERTKFPRSSCIILSATLSIRSISLLIEFQRGISETDFHVRIPSAVADELRLIANHGQQHNTTVEDIIAVSAVIEKTTDPFERDSSEASLSPTLMLDAKLSSLSDLAADLITGADEKRRELDSYRETLDAEFQGKRAQFAREEQELRREISSKAKAVEDLRAELDDREHKHVRRELRETITSQIKESLGKHSGSVYSRAYSMQVTGFCLLGALATGFFAYWTQSTISSGLLIGSYD